jgi:single-strand DNA-binding protein
MNRVNLIGNLTKDVELKQTQSGKSVVSFSIAVNGYGDNVDFINCVAWNKTAEFLSSYATKGAKLGVDGRISTRSYENSEGKKVNVVEVVADQVDLLTPRDTDPKFDTGPKVVDKDDLPF